MGSMRERITCRHQSSRNLPAHVGGAVIPELLKGFLKKVSKRPVEGKLSIFRVEVSTGKKELWREFKPPEPGAIFFGPVALSADGKSYAFSFQRDLAVLYLATGLS